ncbi:N-6 DNA methylase [Pontiellaceae bacterium B12219]|nr:N-6 DNA methylase [Pontiellaceae bacterium B12219]
MLDTETKRRIDSCRDILVGKVPDPKSQVEQITIALIYKFMSDMDAESVELGGKRKFFAGDYRKYDWSQLMASNMGGHDVLHLYSEAITKMSQNTGLPELFRDIFKNAFLPYRDPETLRSFLKEINVFTYDHSEKLGDAFEYLLSVLGSQGDAGQFRTPRHIIDFMVDVMDPQKNESILDPACGTAGFLISSYKHIRAANTKKRLGDKLTADDKKRLVKNIHGYDISPDMVRLSLVNLYLHGFTEPHIEEYDTLTSEEKWNELSDVILANPPFMSPKGGIKPHKRFAVQAKRSEVLFMDYIAEHLTPTGRAAVIVPEGIIFQSGTAYKALRKMLVEQSLVAVVSLPAGVFQPYSGVKTSILIMNKRLAKKRDDILFVKIENDGFGLGAQRREVSGEQLTEAAELLKKFFGGAQASATADGEAAIPPHLALAVPKKQIAENGEYNLSGERYKVAEMLSSDYPLVELGEVCNLIGGGTPSKKDASFWENGSVKWISSKHINDQFQVIGSELITEKAVQSSATKVVPKGSTILITRVSVGKFAFADEDYAVNQDLTGLVVKAESQLNPKYLFCISKHLAEIIERSAEGIGVRGVTRKFLSSLQIPLPPLAVQQEIVAEIEGYQEEITNYELEITKCRKKISKTINRVWGEDEEG